MLRERKKIEVDSKKIVAYLLGEGKVISEVAKIIGTEFWPLYRFIRSENLGDAMTARHGRRLSKRTLAEIRRLLMREGCTPVEIQRRLKLRSRTTIYCLLAEMRRAEEKKAGEFQPRETSEVRRCPKHGLLTVWPCVACEAERANVAPAAIVEDEADDEFDDL